MPVRKITNTGSRKNTGYVPSLKNERPITYESLLERDCIYLFEFDDSVISFFEQPFKITYSKTNKIYSYTPDFQVNYRNKKAVIFEVKPKIIWNKIRENESKYLKYIAANRYCIANGLEFKVLTDEELYSGYLVKNIKYLFGYSRLNVPASIKMHIRNLLIENGKMGISEILFHLNAQSKEDTSQNYQYILSLLYSKYIRTDFDNPLSKLSPIFL